MLLDEADVTEGMLSALESFICAAYSPKGINIKAISQLRWHLFCKHRKWHAPSNTWSSEAAHLESPCPNKSMGTGSNCSAGSTAGSSAKLILQTLWCHAQTSDQRSSQIQRPSLSRLVHCKCKSDCSSGRCSCRAKDMCQCSSQCQNDDDSQAVMYESDDDYDDI